MFGISAYLNLGIWEKAENRPISQLGVKKRCHKAEENRPRASVSLPQPLGYIGDTQTQTRQGNASF